MARRSKGARVSGDLAGVKVGDDYPVRIMGVINLDGSSFYGGSVSKSRKSLLQTAVEMESQGADIIDVGARSTAPYRRADISTRREEQLLRNALRTLFSRLRVPLSADTARGGPAKAALEEGALAINDPYGLCHKDGEALASLCLEFEASLIMTAHERMNSSRARDPMKRVSVALSRSLALASATGLDLRKTVLDPGVGFFSDRRISNVEWNSSIVSNLDLLRDFGRPILVGLSRKRFIGILGGRVPPEERLPGSLSAAAIAVYNGAHIIRTHDVKETKQAILVASAMRQYRQKRLSR